MKLEYRQDMDNFSSIKIQLRKPIILEKKIFSPIITSAVDPIRDAAAAVSYIIRIPLS